MSASALQAQTLRGRVVDDLTRQPVASADVTLDGSAGPVARASTDAAGFFTVKAPVAGTYRIAVSAAGYAQEFRTVELGIQDQTLAAFVLKPAAIPIDPVEAAARANPRPSALSRPSAIIAGSRMAALERHGGRFLTALREISDLRITETATLVCIESRRRITTMRPRRLPQDCEWPQFIIDGVPVEGEASTIRGMHLYDIESIEYYPPSEAGQRYGLNAGAFGAIVIWTRGRGPHADSTRNK